MENVYVLYVDVLTNIIKMSKEIKNLKIKIILWYVIGVTGLLILMKYNLLAGFMLILGTMIGSYVEITGFNNIPYPKTKKDEKTNI